MQETATIILLGTALGIVLFFAFMLLERHFGKHPAPAPSLSRTDDGYLRESPMAALTVFLRSVRYADEAMLSICVSGWEEGGERYRERILSEPLYRETFTISRDAPYAWTDPVTGRRRRGERIEGFITREDRKVELDYFMCHEDGYWKVSPEVTALPEAGG